MGRALVTGATGFIGSHLKRRLRDEGAEVHAVSRRQIRSGPDVRWWQVDLADPDAVRALVHDVRPDRIYDLAGVPVGHRSVDAVLPTFIGNLASTVHMLTAAASVGCERIVLAGSLEVPLLESEGSFASSPYAASKWGAAMYARMFHELFGTPVVVARIFMTYGPGQDRNKLVPYAIGRLLRGQAPELTSGVRPVDWIYVDDVVDGLIAAAQVPGIEGATVDLGSGTLVTVRDMVETLISVAGAGVTPVFGALPDRPHEQVRAADAAATEALLGWKPKVRLRSGLQTTLDWYRDHADHGS